MGIVAYFLPLHGVVHVVHLLQYSPTIQQNTDLAGNKSVLFQHSK